MPGNKASSSSKPPLPSLTLPLLLSSLSSFRWGRWLTNDKVKYLTELNMNIGYGPYPEVVQEMQGETSNSDKKKEKGESPLSRRFD